MRGTACHRLPPRPTSWLTERSANQPNPFMVALKFPSERRRDRDLLHRWAEPSRDLEISIQFPTPQTDFVATPLSTLPKASESSTTNEAAHQALRPLTLPHTGTLSGPPTKNTRCTCSIGTSFFRPHVRQPINFWLPLQRPKDTFSLNDPNGISSGKYVRKKKTETVRVPQERGRDSERR